MSYYQADWQEHLLDRSLCETFYIGRNEMADIIKSCNYNISELARLGIQDLFDRDVFEYNTKTKLGRCMLVLPQNREQRPSHGFGVSKHISKDMPIKMQDKIVNPAYSFSSVFLYHMASATMNPKIQSYKKMSENIDEDVIIMISMGQSRTIKFETNQKMSWADQNQFRIKTQHVKAENGQIMIMHGIDFQRIIQHGVVSGEQNYPMQSPQSIGSMKSVPIHPEQGFEGHVFCVFRRS